jgi:hypothetical protein
MSFVLIPYSTYLGEPPDFDAFYINDGYLWDFMTPLITQFSQNFLLTYEKEDLIPFYLPNFRWEITQLGAIWQGQQDFSRSLYDPRSSWFHIQEMHFPQMQLSMQGALWEWSKRAERTVPVRNYEANTQGGEIEDSPLIAPSFFSSESVFQKPLHDHSFGFYYSYNPYWDLSAFWNAEDWDSPSQVRLQDPEYVASNLQNHFSLQGLGAFWGRYLVVQTSTRVDSHWLSYFYESLSFEEARQTRNDINLEQFVTVGSYFAQDAQFFKNSYISHTVGFNFFSYVQESREGEISQDWNYLFKEGSLRENQTEILGEFSGKMGGVNTFVRMRALEETWRFDETFRGWLDFHPLNLQTLWSYRVDAEGYRGNLWTNEFTYHPVGDIYVKTSLSYDPFHQQMDAAEFFFKASLFEFGFWYRQSIPYDFDRTLGDWVVRPGFEGKTIFQPTKMRFALVGDAFKTTFMQGKGIFFLNLDTGYETLLTRFTDGEFWFKWRLGFRLNNFTEFSLSSFSNNLQMFRYFPSLMARLGYPDKQLSFWQDLGDSLSFWNPAALERTNFKWQAMELRFRQIFYDWHWDLTWAVAPYRYEVNGVPNVALRHDFSVSVRWTPLRSIRAFLVKEKTDTGYRTGLGEDP